MVLVGSEVDIVEEVRKATGDTSVSSAFLRSNLTDEISASHALCISVCNC